jgi:hypothetical protein
MPEINPIVYAIAAVCFTYLLAMYIMQRVKSKKLDNKTAETKAAYEEAKAQLKESRDKLIDAIARVYGNDYAYMVSTETLWEGMPTQLLLVAKGKANNIKQTADTNAIFQTWSYHKLDSMGKTKSSLEITIKNNLVIRWEEVK